MITESFLNSCFSVILNKESRIKKTKILYRDILDIISFSEKKETVKIPIAIQSKLDCLKKICELLLTDKTIENVLDSIAFSEKFNQYRDFLDIKINEALKDHVFQDIIKQIRLRKKINALFKNYDELNNVLESIKDGSFDSIDDLVEDYEFTIRTLYSNMMESNRSTAIEATASLDLLNDDYSHVIEMIKKKYDKSNKTSTGFTLIDNEILWGGYEPSRLYVWGGGSGAGKSTMLNNSVVYSATKNPLLFDHSSTISKPGEINKVYVYVTMENTIEEALMRTYMPLFSRTIVQMLHDIKNGVDIKKSVTDKLAESGSAVIMKYYPAMSISVLDLMGVVDDVYESYGKDIKIAGLYVDYLDLLKTDTRYDMYRLELGHITLALKTLAVQYNVPVITGTQLGRSSYKIKESASLGVDQISESIKKVEHADFVGLLAKDPIDDTIVHGKIGKNRSGKSNLSLDFKVDFSKFKFVSVTKSSNKEKADSVTPKDDRGFTFDGFHTL
ncbi:MAG: DnaB-like helicase C-terminal domain-containing protein [Candidatus Thorarchaeota archaeon]